MGQREKIYQKFVRIGHFIFSILDKLEFFLEKNLTKQSRETLRFDSFLKIRERISENKVRGKVISKRTNSVKVSHVARLTTACKLGINSSMV